MAEELERIYVIPLKKTGYKSSKAAPTSIKRVKNYLTRHMKVEEKDIWIDDSLNNALWSQGKYNIPNKIRVKAVKFDDGVVEAYLPELMFKKSRRELLKEEKEKKEPILRKEEMPKEEGTGAEDYDITPTADGEVKIKKKKPAKKKEEKPKEKKEKPVKNEKETKEEKPKKTEKKTEYKKKETKKKTTTKSKSSSKNRTTKKKQRKSE